MTKPYDVLIIGSGPAGLTAAIYTTRYNLSTLIIGEIVGGQMTEVSDIENYPGFESISGLELGQKMLEQSQKLGAEFLGESVEEAVKQNDGTFKVKTSTGQEFVAKSIILTSGTEPKRLDVPGEKGLRGRGVSYCVTCDGPLFKNKTVIVIGGGDSAFMGALELAGYVRQVYLIHRNNNFKAKPALIESVKNNPKVIIIPNTNIISVDGDKRVTGVMLDQPFEGNSKLLVDGIFVEIGSQPSVKLSLDLEVSLNEYNFVEVAVDQTTSVPGVCAAGDITTGSDGVRQIVTACGEAAIASRSIYHYLQAKLTGEVMTPHATIDPKKCVGCGICTQVAPNSFQLNVKTELSELKKTATAAEIRKAIKSCPENAIQ
ncbi:MAG: FAD-dependent oxidoreductase [candidate division WWE3 bacterium]|nr:FAD-dependent oxidoreductase [candidate division WWE3 bacterium]